MESGRDAVYLKDYLAQLAEGGQLSKCRHRNSTPRVAPLPSPDATAFDLIGYEARTGGLDAVATILAELAEKLDADKLLAIAPTVPLPWVQRLGYLLVRIGEAPKANLLKDYVRKHARESTALVPSAPIADRPRDRDWKLIVNADIEAET